MRLLHARLRSDGDPAANNLHARNGATCSRRANVARQSVNSLRCLRRMNASQYGQRVTSGPELYNHAAAVSDEWSCRWAMGGGLTDLCKRRPGQLGMIEVALGHRQGLAASTRCSHRLRRRSARRISGGNGASTMLAHAARSAGPSAIWIGLFSS